MPPSHVENRRRLPPPRTAITSRLGASARGDDIMNARAARGEGRGGCDPFHTTRER